jgi:hypothetical protein
MWRLLVSIAIGIAIRSRHWAGFDRGKAKAAFLVRRYSSEARELRIKGLWLTVLRMRVLAVRIGLPNLQKSIRHWDAIAVENAAFDPDPLAGNTLLGKVVLNEPVQPNLEKWSDGLRGGRLQAYSVLHRSCVAPAQNKVEMITQGVLRNCALPVKNGNQAVARFFIGGAVENRIERN